MERVACVSCMNRIARQTTFFLFPILIIPVLDMESPQRDPRPPHPTYHHPVRSWRHACRDRLPSPDIAQGHFPDITRIALDAPSYPILASPIHAGPDIAQGCPSRKALSGRTWHHIRPDYAPHRRTVLHHIDMRHITPFMPYHDPQSENQKDSKMSHPLYTQLPNFALFVSKFYFCTDFTHWYLLKISNLRIF